MPCLELENKTRERAALARHRWGNVFLKVLAGDCSSKARLALAHQLKQGGNHAIDQVT
jgi:hypothetical protein